MEEDSVDEEWFVKKEEDEELLVKAEEEDEELVEKEDELEEEELLVGKEEGVFVSEKGFAPQASQRERASSLSNVQVGHAHMLPSVGPTKSSINFETKIGGL